MRIIAYDRFKPGVTMETIEPYLPEEVANVWRLWKAGVVRELCTRRRTRCRDRLRARSVEAAKRYTDDFPLTKGGFLEWFFIPLMIPLPIESLFRSDVDWPNRTTERPRLELRPAPAPIGGRMERYHQIEIPKTLEDACDPRHLALIVYDMQVGVVGQLDDGPEVTARVVRVLDAARKQVSASISPAT